MQKIRIFYPTKDNKVAFTKKELEELINEVYEEGYNDGKASHWSITTPYYPTYPTYYTTSGAPDITCVTTSCSSDEPDKVTTTTHTFKADDKPCINAADYGFSTDINDIALKHLRTIFQGEDD